jgi:Predicted membrane protein (DUF2142)
VRIRVTLAVGLALTAMAVFAVLRHAPLTVAGGNGVQPVTQLGVVQQAGAICQRGEALPRDITAIRLPFEASTGPRIAVTVFSGRRVITGGAIASGWYGSAVTVAVRPLPHAYSDVKICAGFGSLTGEVFVRGEPASRGALGRDGSLPGQLSIVYLRPGGRSWWSLAGSVIDRMALGRAASGTWIVFPIVALIATAIALASLALTRELGDRPYPCSRQRRVGPASTRLWRRVDGGARQLPTAAWICAVVAVLNAAGWSLVTPPFQAPDEPSHFAYVQDLAEAGTLPMSPSEGFSPAEEIALRDLRQREVRYSPQNHTISSAAQQRQLQHDLALPLARVGAGAGVAASEPPLYYALETLPYFDGSGGTILDRLALMRLFSALTAGLSALFVFLFLREALPAARWAWVVGGLGVAFAPLLGLMSGAVSPDALLCAVASALFYCLARGFRRGLTPRLALVTGFVIAAGLLTKLSFVGLMPGVALGLLLLVARARGVSRRAAYWSLVLAGTAALVPFGCYVLVDVLTGRSADGTLSNGIALSTAHGSDLRELSYIWQYYLPRLPGMHNDFPGLFTTRKFWINGFVGLYGWVDTVFPAWVYNIALIPLALLTALLLRALRATRHTLRRRLAELTVYAAMAIGLLVLIGANDYLEYPTTIGDYAQPRYLLPVIALYGAALALAARGAGRRWGPVAGAAIVVLLIAHDVFSQLLEISRFYG